MICAAPVAPQGWPRLNKPPLGLTEIRPPKSVSPERISLGASPGAQKPRSEEHTSELQSLMRISYAVFCLKKKKTEKQTTNNQQKQQKQTTNHAIISTLQLQCLLTHILYLQK